MTAVFAGAILAKLPTIGFSGLIIPVSAPEIGARIAGQLWPTTHYLSASVGVFTRGLGLDAIAGDILALALCVPVSFALGMAAPGKRAR